MNAVMKKKGLGRGLDALLGGSVDITEAVTSEGAAERACRFERCRRASISRARAWTKAALQELAASIRAQGLMQPILVRSIGRTSTKSSRASAVFAPRASRASTKCRSW